MTTPTAESLREILDIPRSEYTRVASALFAYLFQVINCSQYGEYVGDKVLSRATLKAAKASGYVLRNCKLYAYACWVARERGEPLPRASSYQVTTQDGAFLRRLNLKAVGTRFFAFTLPDYEKLMHSVLGTNILDAYIGKYVTKKMSFLIKSYGVQRETLEHSLLRSALYAVYKQYPRYESKLHVINICKTSIHNAGMNLIQYHTRAKRQELRKTSSGAFEAVSVPLDEIMALPAEEKHPFKDSLQALVSLEHRMAANVKEFLQCAAGQYHEGLSIYLGKPNDDAVEVMPYPKYLGKLQNYFQVSEQQTQRLFLRLRTHIM